MTSSLAARWTVIDRAIQSYRFRKVVSLIPPDSVVVDVGCGDGSFLRAIDHIIKQGFGADRTPPDQPDIKRSFVRVNNDDLVPLPSGFADVVTGLALLEHLDDPCVFITEAYRMLKPGGLLILTTPSPAAKPLLEFLAFRLRIISINDIADHKKYYSHSELLPLFSSFYTSKIKPFQFGLNTLVIAVK